MSYSAFMVHNSQRYSKLTKMSLYHYDTYRR